MHTPLNQEDQMAEPLFQNNFIFYNYFPLLPLKERSKEKSPQLKVIKKEGDLSGRPLFKVIPVKD